MPQHPLSARCGFPSRPCDGWSSRHIRLGDTLSKFYRQPACSLRPELVNEPIKFGRGSQQVFGLEPRRSRSEAKVRNAMGLDPRERSGGLKPFTVPPLGQGPLCNIWQRKAKGGKPRTRDCKAINRSHSNLLRSKANPMGACTPYPDLRKVGRQACDGPCGRPHGRKRGLSPFDAVDAASKRRTLML